MLQTSYDWDPFSCASTGCCGVAEREEASLKVVAASEASGGGTFDHSSRRRSDLRTSQPVLSSIEQPKMKARQSVSCLTDS